VSVVSQSTAQQQEKKFVVEIPFAQVRNLLPKDGDPISVWKGKVAWPRDRHPEQRQEYGEIAFGRNIRSHPNDRNDRDQPWMRPGIIARKGYVEIRAGWRVKIDGLPGPPHYDGTISANLHLKVEKGKVKASLDNLKATHRGGNLFIDAYNLSVGLFRKKIDLAGLVKQAVERESAKILATLDNEVDGLLKKQPQLRQFRDRISIDIIGDPKMEAGGTVRVTVSAP
jgi:hypothetical protein